MNTPFRTIPDTNVVIAAQNANPNSPNAEYFERQLHQEFVVLYCEDTLKEYIKKLVEKQIPTQLINSLIIAILELGERVDIEFFHCPIYPIDVDDIPFLLCAVNGKASHVISYDAHLHALNGRYSFIVCKPLEFLFELRAAAQKDVKWTRMKDLAQLDGWLRDGSAAFVNSLCEWSSYWRLSDTSKVSDSFFDLVLIMLALHHQKERL